MKRHRWVIVAAAICGGAAATWAAVPGGGLPIPPSVLKEVAEGKPAAGAAGKKDQEHIAALKERALTADSAVALPAIRELKGMGNVARPTLIGVLKTVLSRDQELIQSAVAGIGDGKEAADFEARIDTLRAEARANVAVLDKAKPETIKKAHEYYDQLIPMTARMNQAWGMRMAIVEGMGRRGELVRIWREVAPANDKSFTVDAETKLKQAAVKAVGAFVDQAAGMEWGKPPRDESLKPLWFFGVSRKIEAWNNRHMEQFMDAEEIKDFNFVNVYREAIGLLPYEADPRLVQAARRHSKEMVEKNYFSHESPTASEKDFGMRSKNAGYAGGAGENIASGTGTGEATFWLWFDSPGHHKNFAGGQNALGVGRWRDRWTQNFGGAPRVMQMSEEEQSRVKVEGDVLGPDSGRK
ncbi:MAG: Allergen V5/Tpx related [Phycisphaerales bacterium]|nr:Allergen V5/Tpx related [Phycisphaerales bacterium]